MATEPSGGDMKRRLQRLRHEPLSVLKAAIGEILGRFFLREQHAWYQLDLDGGGQRRELPEGVALVRATETQLIAVADLGQSPKAARRRLQQGNDVWIVTEGRYPLFACYTFRRETPVTAAPNGLLPLPPGTACLEDSVTSARARGRGIAPAAWCAIGDRLRSEGFEAIVTKIETSNTPSLRAIEKAGFREVAVMSYTRTGPLRRTAVQVLSADGVGAWLAAALSIG
jgi:hypothetical protein